MPSTGVEGGGSNISHQPTNYLQSDESEVSESDSDGEPMTVKPIAQNVILEMSARLSH